METKLWKRETNYRSYIVISILVLGLRAWHNTTFGLVKCGFKTAHINGSRVLHKKPRLKHLGRKKSLLVLAFSHAFPRLMTIWELCLLYVNQFYYIAFLIIIYSASGFNTNQISVFLNQKKKTKLVCGHEEDYVTNVDKIKGRILFYIS